MSEATAKYPRISREHAVPGPVLLYNCTSEQATEHETASRTQVCRRLATLLQREFGGESAIGGHVPVGCYLVPTHTMDIDQASTLGIRGEGDLFGGAVPTPWAATKIIMHPLVDRSAYSPPGWPADLAASTQELAVAGYSAFRIDDLRRACLLLLERGPVRLKPAVESGGRGQIVVSESAELEHALSSLDLADLWDTGVVVEENLPAPVTYSIGQIRVADLLASYYGTQRTTFNNLGEAVYGGSELFIIRGDFDTLAAATMPPNIRGAVFCARAFDELVHEKLPGFFASRRNYDVIAGSDANGEQRCCLLEHSWRIGGASGAEIAALEAFRDDPNTAAVEVRCVEAYGEDLVPPPGATIYFHGFDPELGPMLKYAMVGQRHGRA